MLIDSTLRAKRQGFNVQKRRPPGPPGAVSHRAPRAQSAADAQVGEYSAPTTWNWQCVPLSPSRAPTHDIPTPQSERVVQS
jgi:hypothetical protein